METSQGVATVITIEGGMGLFDVAIECEERFENFLTNIACKSGFMGFSVEESGSIHISWWRVREIV